MTGCALITDTVSVIIVEGGPKAQKKYEKVVLNRIKWNADAEDDDDDERYVARVMLVLDLSEGLQTVPRLLTCPALAGRRINAPRCGPAWSKQLRSTNLLWRPVGRAQLRGNSWLTGASSTTGT